MEAVPAPLIAALEPDNKRPCIRIKARIKIQGEQQSLTPIVEAVRPYQAYCETVTSSRSQTPDIFTTPPTHAEPSSPVQTPRTPTYKARIITRKANASSAYRAARLQDVAVPGTSDGNSNEGDVAAQRDLSKVYLAVQQSTPPRSNHSDKVADRMSRNRTPSLSQVRQANLRPQTTIYHTPLKQKRYERMEYHPLPPLPPSPPASPSPPADDEQISAKTMVNFSRGEISPKTSQVQNEMKASHRSCGNPTPEPTSSAPDVNLASIQAEDERPHSNASRRAVTFADDTTVSSRSSWPVHHSHAPDRTLRQSKSFCTETQIPSSLRLYRSHDSLLAANPVSKKGVSTNAARRTTPKDFKHKYSFGQRPNSRAAPPVSPVSPGRSSNPNYNPRLSTSKAQYCGLASLPRPLPSSLRIAQPQAGPRQPPWGSLGHLEEQRERRLDARERDQAKQFRTAALSEATTLAETDVYGKDRMKKEVEEYREQVVSVYPDMAFDGSAGKGGRGCCCVVM
jgi:hypothetical protein